MFERKPIYLIVAQSEYAPFNNQLLFHQWDENFFELQMIAEVTSFFITKPQEKPTVEIWLKIARLLKREWLKFEGVVIVLPQQEFHFAATYISFLIGAVGKPIIFVPHIISRSEEAHQQLSFHTAIVNAAQASIAPFAGTATMIGTEITNTILTTEQGGEICPAAERAVIGRIDFGVQVTGPVQPRSTQRPIGPFTYPSHVIWYHTDSSTLNMQHFSSITQLLLLEGDDADRGGHNTNKGEFDATRIPNNTKLVLLEGEEAEVIAKTINVSFPVVGIRTIHKDSGQLCSGIVVEQGKAVLIPTMDRTVAIAKCLWIAGMREQMQESEKESVTFTQQLTQPVLNEFITPL